MILTEDDEMSRKAHIELISIAIQKGRYKIAAINMVKQLQTTKTLTEPRCPIRVSIFLPAMSQLTTYNIQLSPPQAV